MLIGQYQSQFGEKNRVMIPKKFRNILGEQFIVARWYEKCLVLVSLQSWDTLISKVTGQSNLVTTPVRDTDRFILGSAFEIEVDAQGRFIVPGVLKDYAGFKNEVIFLGLGDRIEVWDKEEWEKREKYIAENAAELLENIAKGISSNA